MIDHFLEKPSCPSLNKAVKLYKTGVMKVCPTPALPRTPKPRVIGELIPLSDLIPEYLKSRNRWYIHTRDIKGDGRLVALETKKINSILVVGRMIEQDRAGFKVETVINYGSGEFYHVWVYSDNLL